MTPLADGTTWAPLLQVQTKSLYEHSLMVYQWAFVSLQQRRAAAVAVQCGHGDFVQLGPPLYPFQLCMQYLHLSSRVLYFRVYMDDSSCVVRGAEAYCVA